MASASDEDVLIVGDMLHVLGLSDDILFVEHHFFRLRCFVLLRLGLLLVIGNLLEPEEVLTRLFVELLVDIVNCLLNARNQNKLQCVHTSVRHLQSLVKRHELSLQTGDSNQNLKEPGVGLTSALNGLTTTRHSQEVLVFVHFVFAAQGEDGQVHTSDVLGAHVETHRGAGLNMVQHASTEITCRKSSLGQSNSGIFKVSAHAHLCFDNLLKDSSEGLFESVRLLLEKFVAFLGSNSFGLVKLKGPEIIKHCAATYMREGNTCCDIFD